MNLWVLSECQIEETQGHTLWDYCRYVRTVSPLFKLFFEISFKVTEKFLTPTKRREIVKPLIIL